LRAGHCAGPRYVFGMRIAIVCSAHGLGHLTRQLALAPHLRAGGAEVVFFTAAPPAILYESLPGASIVPWTADVGIRQHDSLTEDLPETVRLLAERCADSAVDALAAALVGFDRVIADAAPAALEAARRAGVPAVAVGNFSWPWIYDHYPRLQPWAKRLRAWQRPHPAVSLWPGPGLLDSGFARVHRAGLVGRRAEAHPMPAGAVLVSFGGFGLDALDAALPRIDGVTWVLAPPMAPLDRPDCLYLEGVPYPAMVAGVDVVLTKPGYGIFAEAALGQTRLLWVERGAFPEAPHMVVAMRARGDVAVGAAPGTGGFAARLGAALEAARARPRPPAVADDTARLAGWLLSGWGARRRSGGR